jgi:DNA-binding PadR family transcriptional regulator
VVEKLNWAEKNHVKYIGMDNGVMGAVPGLIVPKLQELESKGFIIGGMVFGEPGQGL